MSPYTANWRALGDNYVAAVSVTIIFLYNAHTKSNFSSVQILCG